MNARLHNFFKIIQNGLSEIFMGARFSKFVQNYYLLQFYSYYN